MKREGEVRSNCRQPEIANLLALRSDHRVSGVLIVPDNNHIRQLVVDAGLAVHCGMLKRAEEPASGSNPLYYYWDELLLSLECLLSTGRFGSGSWTLWASELEASYAYRITIGVLDRPLSMCRVS